jgi:hypothetical protein
MAATSGRRRAGPPLEAVLLSVARRHTFETSLASVTDHAVGHVQFPGGDGLGLSHTTLSIAGTLADERRRLAVIRHRRDNAP